MAVLLSLSKCHGEILMLKFIKLCTHLPLEDMMQLQLNLWVAWSLNMFIIIMTWESDKLTKDHPFFVCFQKREKSGNLEKKSQNETLN